jgi:hypothetical protein
MTSANMQRNSISVSKDNNKKLIVLAAAKHYNKWASHEFGYSFNNKIIYESDNAYSSY